MDLLEQEFSLFPLVWSGLSKIRAGNYGLIPTVQILTVHCEIWSDAPDSEACLTWRSKMWPLLCVFLFLILSPDFAAAVAVAVVVVRGGGAGGDVVEDDNIFFSSFSSSSCFPSLGEELSGRECDEGCKILLSWLESIVVVVVVEQQ